MKLSPAEELAYCTVRIECDLPDHTVGCGTGFFYGLNRNGEEYVPVIVTNKHVIKNAIKGRFILTLEKTNGEPDIGVHEAFELNSFEKLWTPHPDESVDLCAMPIAALLRDAEQRNIKFFFRTLEKQFIPTSADIEDMIGLENIIMVGYPNGLWDKVNNLPIFRNGILATNFKQDWNGKKEFLIDAACYPGSSGSPVLLFDIGSYSGRSGNKVGESRIKLLGVLYAGTQYSIEGDIKVVNVPTQQKAVSTTNIPNNLGIIIKSEQLYAFEGLF